jgi:hypothetical protein
MSSDGAAAALADLGRLGNAMTAPLGNVSQAVRLAEVISRTELDPWDAQVAMIADVSVCPILTLDAAKWESHLRDLDEPLHIIEVADSDENQP